MHGHAPPVLAAVLAVAAVLVAVLLAAVGPAAAALAAARGEGFTDPQPDQEGQGGRVPVQGGQVPTGPGPDPVQVRLVAAEELALQARAYFASLTPLDLHARGFGTMQQGPEGVVAGLVSGLASAREACRSAYLADVLPPADGLARAVLLPTLAGDVRAAARLLRRACRAYPQHRLLCGARAAEEAAVWRVALLREGRVEGGWPHTHGRTVCLPLSYFRAGDRERLRVLLHERVHVLQRADPGAMAAWARDRGYAEGTPLADLPDDVDIRRRIRANPDLDGRAYGRVQAYSSDRPVALSDSRCVVLAAGGAACGPGDHEHPNEHAAYELADQLLLLGEGDAPPG
jgi:hypothetical protein